MCNRRDTVGPTPDSAYHDRIGEASADLEEFPFQHLSIAHFRVATIKVNEINSIRSSPLVPATIVHLPSFENATLP